MLLLKVSYYSLTVPVPVNWKGTQQATHLEDLPSTVGYLTLRNPEQVLAGESSKPSCNPQSRLGFSFP